MFASRWANAGPAADAASAPIDAGAFAPRGAAAELFVAAARAYFDGRTNATAPMAADAAQVFTNFLREHFAEFQSPWNTGGRTGPSKPGEMPSISDSLALGETREHQLRLQRMAKTWQRLEDAQRRLQRIWTDVLFAAATAFVAAQQEAPPVAFSAGALRKLYDTWIDCAEDAYARAAHGEAFCNALADAANASSEWRRELQAAIEHSAKLLDLPTRSELNTLTRRLKSAEEELRALRNQRKSKTTARSTRQSRSKAKP